MRSFAPVVHPHVPPHTLILGSAPSIKSLELHQNFGHPHNAFWHIAGAALGFVRVQTPYAEQTRRMTAAGFAVWDVIASCVRRGSSDSDVRAIEPNDIRGFLLAHPSVRRIVINSQATAAFFQRLHRAWYTDDAQLCLRWANDTARRVFAKDLRDSSAHASRPIDVLVMPSTSPAYASVRYNEKERIWLRECYAPGVALLAAHGHRWQMGSAPESA